MSASHLQLNSIDVDGTSTGKSVTGSFRVRIVGTVILNAWLCYHLIAVIIAPASVEPATPLMQSAWTWVAGYLQLLYLNHGFHFFSPEPAGSSLVRCVLEFSDGTTRSVQLPNRTIRPRLLYHRHFMLTEFLGNGPEEYRPLLQRAIARNLCRTTGAVKATLFLVYHDTPSVDDVLAGKSLNETSSFTETELGSYLATELAEPYRPPVIAPAAPLHLQSDDTNSIPQGTSGGVEPPEVGVAVPLPTAVNQSAH
jgi:hypothetical protein